MLSNVHKTTAITVTIRTLSNHPSGCDIKWTVRPRSTRWNQTNVGRLCVSTADITKRRMRDTWGRQWEIGTEKTVVVHYQNPGIFLQCLRKTTTHLSGYPVTRQAPEGKSGASVPRWFETS
jgi:hypothetical protein